LQFRFTPFFLPEPSAQSRRWVPLGPLSVIAFLNSMFVAYVVEEEKKKKKNSRNKLETA